MAGCRPSNGIIHGQLYLCMEEIKTLAKGGRIRDTINIYIFSKKCCIVTLTGENRW